MTLNRVEVDVMEMLVVIVPVPDAVVCEAALPYLGIRTQFLFRSEGEPALDELHGAFQRDGG